MEKFYYTVDKDTKTCMDYCNHIREKRIGSIYCRWYCYLRHNHAIHGEDENGYFIICRNAYKK